jgi:hypothetical protein
LALEELITGTSGDEPEAKLTLLTGKAGPIVVPVVALDEGIMFGTTK